MQISLKDRLERWFKGNPQWHAKGDVLRMVSEKTSYTPDNTGRRLRELEVEGVIEVDYRKGHAWYRYKQTKTPLEWFEELPEIASQNEYGG